GDEDLLHARQLARLAVQLDQRAVVGIEVLADAGEHAGRLATVLLDVVALAAQAVHVGGRAAQVRDHAGEAAHFLHLLDLVEDRFVGTALDDAPLVLGDGAEGAAAEAAAHD